VSALVRTGDRIWSLQQTTNFRHQRCSGVRVVKFNSVRSWPAPVNVVEGAWHPAMEQVRINTCRSPVLVDRSRSTLQGGRLRPNYSLSVAHSTCQPSCKTFLRLSEGIPDPLRSLWLRSSLLPSSTLKLTSYLLGPRPLLEATRPTDVYRINPFFDSLTKSPAAISKPVNDMSSERRNISSRRSRRRQMLHFRHRRPRTRPLPPLTP
jgi:hypothetical protein